MKKRGNVTMRMIVVHGNLSVRVSKVLQRTLMAALLYCGSLGTAQTTNSPPTTPPRTDLKQVEDAMGRPGQIQPGDVMRFGMPRKDLHVVLDGVDLKAGLALGSGTGFKRGSTGARV